jgi:hypothetical protein
LVRTLRELKELYFDIAGQRMDNIKDIVKTLSMHVMMVDLNLRPLIIEHKTKCIRMMKYKK